MKYKITVRYAEGGESWEEDYDDVRITTGTQATAAGVAMVQRFNDTLRPGEKARKFLSAAIVGAGESHAWEKQNIITQSRGRQSFDVMMCSVCRITGKRFGLGPGIKRDSAYRAKKYGKCSGKPFQRKDTDE